jgi:hypothetical protein
MFFLLTHSFLKQTAKAVFAILVLAVMPTSALTEDSAGGGKDVASAPAPQADAVIEKTWGIKALNIRLTASDHFLDFRYRILDPDKAAMLTKRDKKAYLIDQASGKTVTVPVTKLGPLRGTDVKPKKDRVYVVLFSNPNNTVKKGNKVTIVIGDFRAENLVVE